MSKIEWTNKTWNPIVGCTKISEGCKNCYAEKMASRLKGIKSTSGKYYFTVDNGNWNGTTHFFVDEEHKPTSWKKPKMIFVCSMSDLFHEKNPFEWILKIWDEMCQNPRHIFQVLTKRPQRMKEFLEWLGQQCKNDGFDSVPSSSDNLLDYIGVPDHIWLGVTVENQKRAEERIPFLLNIPAKTRFLSCEPLLSDIDFPWYQSTQPTNETVLIDISWVIAGPETGPGARPMHKSWIENLYSQCEIDNVSFFDKKNILGKNIKQFPE